MTKNLKQQSAKSFIADDDADEAQDAPWNNPQTSTFTLTQGPIFCELLLADEINRTPPKTQAALLEAMQERTVSYGGTTYQLPRPFFVLATQNPLEQAGTYPLPEAQLDRFLIKAILPIPPRAAR